MEVNMYSGPNGPIPDEILDLYPDVPVIQRQGEINAWDNPDVKKAIKDTGRTQFIIAGIATDVCKPQQKVPCSPRQSGSC